MVVLNHLGHLIISRCLSLITHQVVKRQVIEGCHNHSSSYLHITVTQMRELYPFLVLGLVIVVCPYILSHADQFIRVLPTPKNKAFISLCCGWC